MRLAKWLVIVALTGCAAPQTQTPTPLPTTCCTTTAPPTTPAPTSTAGQPTPTPTELATATLAPTVSPIGSPSADLPQDGEPVTLDPNDFVSVIDNPWWPMPVGAEWTFRETDGEGGVFKIVVTVTDQTKLIMGITATVVHDIATEDGQPVEDTFDWYAQDRAGNIWYMGEDTKEYENGQVVSTEGSWEAGVDGAYPGVIVPANPIVGQAYRQEYLAGQAEDSAQTLSLDEQVQVTAGAWQGVMLNKEFTPVEPDVLEYKWYAQGVGPVLAIGVSGSSDREELTKYNLP